MVRFFQVVILVLAQATHAQDLAWLNGTWIGDYATFKQVNQLNDAELKLDDEKRMEAFATRATLIYKDNTVTSVVEGLDTQVFTYSYQPLENNVWLLHFDQFDAPERIWTTENGYCSLTEPFWTNIEVSEETKAQFREAIGQDGHMPPEGWIEIKPTMSFCYKRDGTDRDSE
ncbi:MAG: hypothetical protein AAF542_25910 [Pseudomonadota bacterium]